jgi:hypothetical protein
MKFLMIMGACFLVAGAFFTFSSSTPKLRAMGIGWLCTGALLVGVAGLAARSAAHRERLLATGKAGTATVLSVKDTGVTVNNSPRVRVKVRIEAAGAAPVEATNAMFVSRVSVPRAGEVYNVRFDAQNPNDFVFAPGGKVGARTSAASNAEDTLLTQLERLTALRDKGALTPEEFETQKRKLLGKG